MLNSECNLTRLRHNLEVASAGLVLRGVVEDVFDLFVFEAILHTLLLVESEHLLFLVLILLVLIL